MATPTRMDDDGQPAFTGFNFKRNRDKAAAALRGILTGITADRVLVEAEALFLDAWMRSQEQLTDKGEVSDLLETVDSILADGVITAAELQQLHALIDDILAHGDQSTGGAEESINQLLGLLMGMAADNRLTDLEFQALRQWLADNPQVADTWPANQLIKRIEAIMADGVLDEEERSDLLETLKQFSGQRFDETGSADGAVAEVFSDAVDGIELAGKVVCFTGKFVSGTRSACESLAKSRGGIVSKTVTKKLDLLVLGTIASRDWRFTSHGRKIEQALNYRSEGSEILILSERGWLKAIG